jgi:outer membrane lipoprotein SlyB
VTQLVSVVLVCASVAAPVAAEDKPSQHAGAFGALDREARNSLERGLGFVRKFREPGQCKETVDELAGAVTSLSPEVLGAAVGLALGAAAGAASTASVLGALRGGILLGSIGSALGHLADVLLPERVTALADDVQDLIQARDGKLCELIKASDKLRTPVLEHLEASLEETCKLDAASGAALQHCMRDNPEAAEIFERHASVLAAINQGTCRVAASLVRRFERSIAHQPDAQNRPSLAPNCDEPEPGESPQEPQRPLGRNVL